MGSVTVSLVLNGEQRTFEVPAGRRLLDLLRDDAGLTGTKEGCGAGECGACTVLLNGLPVPSCLVLAASCEGADVVTVEGLGGDRPLHPLQRAMVERGGVQCGFCTPGVVTTGAALLEHGITEPLEQGRRLAGNLCRCTGYSKIFEALQAAAREPGDD
ncbi:MAG: 2Fe-2S iron-sulfur cluster binding domain-containing protein [Acidobacteria bacterium]|nr:2Fe-2S iron-sulfur cluster binding domain-containing protein [Acidobacteriota bacterium]